ncbi:MAG: DNA gyrase/topoisomerase IV subunit A [Bacteroidales bacterium]|jgi:topoisomerase-4 subunit A|nr:DNA gyrase/topoisomerase IV subunit A [Bacteroidales bacterium]
MNEDFDENVNAEDDLLNERSQGKMQSAMHISGMYEDWFLDYASYVILERAVPSVFDGLKPVHRRILHSMRELDDGRYNKVANIIGNTMKYHPHGDASIGDALVNIGQKDLLIDMQGNWGNFHTGDRAAAPRYIEARLTKFALHTVFNPKTTEWKLSYDGRNKEPNDLPVKFPLLLQLGVEGIAVGLASKILPHNFIELIDASIRILQEKPFELYPDFQTGGYIDVSKYNEGLRGGKVRIRAKINQIDNKTLVITEIPFSKTTNIVIDTIISANDKGKIKLKKIDDNTSHEVEIVLHLAPGVSPDQTIDALYAFTDCEVSISPNSCVIVGDKPAFLGVSEILKRSTLQTVELLKKELLIKRGELLEQLHNLSLEKIFIENRIYHDIEVCESFDEVIEAIDKGLKPFTKDFIREVAQEDIERLTEIRIKRISKYNSFKADEQIKALNKDLKQVDFHLAHLINFAIKYFKDLKTRFGKGRGRKTEIRSFENIDAATVAVASQKLYVNRKDGFAGISLKKDEYVCMCSDIDDIIVFREDGKFLVTKVNGKVFVGKNIIHIDVFKKGDDRTVYNVVYREGLKGISYVKRFAVTGITRDKEYEFSSQHKGAKIIYFSANPNGEAELLRIAIRPSPRLKKAVFDFDFSELAIKGRGSKGNILSRKPIAKIIKKEDGVSTLGAIDIWYDDNVKRLNTDKRGKYLGAFSGEQKIFTLMGSGEYKFYNFELTNHFDDDILLIEKFDQQKIISALYIEASSKLPYLKRFIPEISEKKINFIGDSPKAKLLDFSIDFKPLLNIELKSDSGKNNKRQIDVDQFIGIKSYKAKGKRLTNDKLVSLTWLKSNSDAYPDIKTEKIEQDVDKEQSIIVEETLVAQKSENIDLDIEVDDKHIIVDEEPQENSSEQKKEQEEKDKGLADDGQIILDL